MKIKEFRLAGHTKGSGTVNYNDNFVPDEYKEQLTYIDKKSGKEKISDSANFSKVIFDENNVRTPIISYQRLNESAFGCHKYDSNELLDETNLLDFLTDKRQILFGFMIPNKKNDSYSRKKPFHIFDAVATNNPILTLHTRTNSSSKTENGGKGSTSLSYYETCGELKTKFEMRSKINHFIITCDNKGYLNVPEKFINLFILKLNEKYAKEIGVTNVGVKCKFTDEDGTCRDGIFLDSKFIKLCVDFAIKKYFNLHITRGGNYAEFDYMEVQLIDENDNLVFNEIKKINSYDEWVELTKNIEYVTTYKIDNNFEMD